jgi:hypothetical protein
VVFHHPLARARLALDQDRAHESHCDNCAISCGQFYDLNTIAAVWCCGVDEGKLFRAAGGYSDQITDLAKEQNVTGALSPACRAAAVAAGSVPTTLCVSLNFKFVCCLHKTLPIVAGGNSVILFNRLPFFCAT